MGQEFENSLCGQLWVQISLEVAARCWLELQVSSEGLTGAGWSATKMAHSHGWHLGTSCWWETRWNFVFIGCSNVLTIWQLASPQSEWSKEEQSRNGNDIFDIVPKSCFITSAIFYGSYRPTLMQHERKLLKGDEARILGAMLVVGYHYKNI